MSKKTEYQKGQAVGDHGCTFIREIKPHISRNGRKRRKAIFKCPRCKGNFKNIIESIICGNTRSCGCLRIDIPNGTTHGLRYTKEYKTWAHIKDRCYNPKNQDYKHYGGRGITMCDEWIDNPQLFYEYVIKLPNYGKSGYTIDRFPNNNGSYEPNNVRWATQQQQCINQRIKSNNTSGYTGVSPHSEKFVATIGRKYIGIRDTALAAAELRDMYIIKNGLWEYPLQVVRST